MKRVVLVPKRLNQVDGARRRELLEEAEELAWRTYEAGVEFDPVFNYVARLELLEAIASHYEIG